MNKKIGYLLITIVAFFFIANLNVEAASPFTLGTTKGTTDPDSYIVEDKATLTINKVSSPDSFKAYKIIDVFYNQTTNVVTYEFTANFKKFLAQSDVYKSLTISDYYNLTSGDIISGSTKTSSTLDKLVSKYASYIKKYGAQSSPSYSLDVSETTAYKSINSGVYLVLPTSARRIYAVMVGNLTPKANNGTWQIDNFTINAKVSDASVVKYIGKVGQTVGSYSYGDEVPCILDVTLPFPTNANGVVILLGDVVEPIFDLPTFEKFTVKMGDTTLTTKSDGTVVDSSGNVVATIEIPNTYWTGQLNAKVVTLNINYKYLTSTKVTVTYGLILNKSANVSTTGNQNTAGLVINRDVYNEGANATGNASYIPYYTYATIYTYGIDLLAYKKGDKSSILSDMTFDVYKDSNLTQKIGTITTDSSGKGTLAGVAEGTYYIKNTKTKSGYRLANTTAMKVKIDGSVASDTDGYYKVEIEVPTATLLPITGGSGAIIYTALGLIIIVASITVFTIYNKKQKQI